MGCGTSSQGQVNQPKQTFSEPQISQKKETVPSQIQNKENKLGQKLLLPVQTLKEIQTQKSINFPNEYIQGQSVIPEKIQSQITEVMGKRSEMDRVILFGQSSTQRKIVNFTPMASPPSFQILLSRNNNLPPMKYQPSEVILEESQQLCSSYMYLSTSHPPYNFMFAAFVDSDCSDALQHKNSSKGLIFLCGGVNYNFDYLSDEAFLYNPFEIQKQQHNPSKSNQSLHLLNAPNKNTSSRKRRIGNNLMGSKFDKLSYMKSKRYSHMGVYYREGKLKYIYVFGGRTDGDLTIKKCEKYSFQEKKWIQIASMTMPRSTGFTMIVNQKIYVFGGYTSEGKRSKVIEKYNPIFDSWQVLNFKLHRGIETGLLLPIPKNNTQILLVGGNVEMGGLKSVIKLNFQNQTYIWDSDLKKQRLLQKGLVLPQQNAAYIFGGDFQDSVQKYSFKDKSWKIVNNITYQQCISPDDINSFTMAQQTIQLQYDQEKQNISQVIENQQNHKITGDYKYVFGSDSYPCIFQLNTSKWVLKKKVVPLSLRLRSQMTVLKIKEGKYFIAGGIDSHDQKSSKCAYIYYSTTNKAIQINKMCEKKHDFGVCLTNNFIYIFGGKSKNGASDKIVQSCERYDIKEDKWLRLPNMPRQRSGCRALLAPQQNAIILVGGTDSSEQSVNQIDILQINQNTWKTLKEIIPIPLEIKQVYQLNKKINLHSSSNNNNNNNNTKQDNTFQFLDSQLQPQKKQQQQKQQQQQNNNKTINKQQHQQQQQQYKMNLLIFNYNSYLKQYNYANIIIDLKNEQIKENTLNNNKIFAYQLAFPVGNNNFPIKLDNINTGKSSHNNQAMNNFAVDQDTQHYFISGKGIFKWKFNPKNQENPAQQIVINQIHLLSMPLEKFCIA